MARGQELAKSDRAHNLLERMGARYGLDPQRVVDTLGKTVFRTAKEPEQIIALMIVADQYKLNPFTREIYAFPDRGGGIVPVVGIDGWLRLINDRPEYAGMLLTESDDLISLPYTVEGQHGPEERETRPCPEWMECTIYRTDREHSTPVREYLAEVFRATEPWTKTTARMLRHKTIIQAARIAFGFGGIKDPDEAAAIQAFDLQGTVLREETVKTIGAADWTKLVKQAQRFGYSEADVRATAETQGFSGPGGDMPEDLAQRIYVGMKANPKPPAADPETGEVQEPQGAYKTPLLD